MTKTVDACPSCPICGGAVHPRYQLPDLSQRLALGTVATVCWCGGCDDGFLFPRPGPEANALLYDDYFQRTSPAAATPGRRRPPLLDRLRARVACRLDRGAMSLLEVVRRHISRIDADLCEIGCGEGNVLSTFARAGLRTIGVEPFAAAASRARDNGLEVLEGTAERLPDGLPRAAFDAVVLTQVLEHCHDPVAAVGNALSLLRPGGLLFIDVPNCGSFQFRDRGMGWFHADPGRHVNYFTPGALRALLGRAGAEEVGSYYAQYLGHFLDERIEIERAARERARRDGGAGELAALPPVSRLRLLGTLVRTCGLRPDRKYGIAGVIARREGAARSPDRRA